MSSEPSDSSQLHIPAPVEPLKPNLIHWRKGKRLYRVHPSTYGATEFNPGTGQPIRRGRFHPIRDSQDRPIPTLYAADRIDGALSETVFHNVIHGSAAIRRQRLKIQLLSTIALERDVTLVDLTGHGLRKLGLRRNQLLESESAHYEKTARWAAVLHASDNKIDGLMWVSRQFDTAKAAMFFGDRLASNDLSIINMPSPLYQGAGFRRVQQIATAAEILIVEG